jgi:hypothetical protein
MTAARLTIRCGTTIRRLEVVCVNTSAPGVRHAQLASHAKMGFAEPKFIVRACAAFMNFLIAKARQHKRLLHSKLHASDFDDGD